MYLFEKLETYNKAVRFAAIVEMMTRDFPRSTDYFAKQFVRSAQGVYQHIAEGHAQWKNNDVKNHFWRARGTIEECFGLIEVAFRQGFISENLKELFRSQLMDLSNELEGMIRGLIQDEKPEDRNVSKSERELAHATPNPSLNN